MAKITVLPHPEYVPDGASIEVDSETTVCDALLTNGIEIEHACGKVGACTTCHVIIRGGFELLPEMTENEEDMLDQAWGLHPHSRLSCQAICDGSDLAVEIPRYSINHAKESG